MSKMTHMPYLNTQNIFYTGLLGWVIIETCLWKREKVYTAYAHIHRHIMKHIISDYQYDNVLNNNHYREIQAM